jgi:hypothetical protein
MVGYKLAADTVDDELLIGSGKVRIVAFSYDPVIFF